MIKTILTGIILLLSWSSHAQTTGNYILLIGKDSIPMNLDSSISYQTPAGEQLTLKIVQPTILTYSDDMISFSHDKSLSVSNSSLGDGIDQCMVIKSTGTGFIVQKYRLMDPSSLTELMLNEITKESISYGYAKTETKFRKRLKSGQLLKGTQAVLTYRGSKDVYTVATYGKRDQGIVVITMLLGSDYVDDRAIIDLFLETLEIQEY